MLILLKTVLFAPSVSWCITITSRSVEKCETIGKTLREQTKQGYTRQTLFHGSIRELFTASFFLLCHQFHYSSCCSDEETQSSSQPFLLNVQTLVLVCQIYACMMLFLIKRSRINIILKMHRLNCLNGPCFHCVVIFIC